MPPDSRRNVCFVTGTRAEFGLMRTTLEAIKKHPKLNLQIVATGMHLSVKHGHSIDQIRAAGWTVDAIVPWSMGHSVANATGLAISATTKVLAKLKSDIVLVVGDRVEAFAAATAGHLSERVVAHVHGGDRALGQVDDALRHAITKLSHLHFAATKQSGERILKLGEDSWRIAVTGAPGIDGIREEADKARDRRRFALIAFHPISSDETAEYRRAKALLDAVRKSGVEAIEIIFPNNDPGWRGIEKAWLELGDESLKVHRDAPRRKFLGLLRDAAVLVGNSSAGIIEAASFGTPVVDVGPRQMGRETSDNVTHTTDSPAAMLHAIREALRRGRVHCENVYGGSGAGRKIAGILGRAKLDDKLRRKLIAY